MTLKCLTWVIGVSGNQKWKTRTLMCLDRGGKEIQSLIYICYI